MNKNQLTIVKEYKFDSPLITNIESIIDSWFEDCHNNYFHNFKYECIFDSELTNINSNEIVNSAISGKGMNLYDLNKKLELRDKMVLYLIK